MTAAHDACTLELIEGVPEHVRFLDGTETLCGVSVAAEVPTRVIPHELSPVAAASIYRCPDCIETWQRIEPTVTREPTAQCRCDRTDEPTTYCCGVTVPAHQARRLLHPDVPGGRLPVCKACYEWVRSRENNVTESYEEATVWDPDPSSDAHRETQQKSSATSDSPDDHSV